MPPSNRTTLAEQSGWRQTGRYEEAVHLCNAFAAEYPTLVRTERFGQTPEGRPMVALVASADGALDPEKARAKVRPVVLVQGGIHAGEIDGKDAGFWLLRDLLEGNVLPGALKKVTLVFVPVANPDGHERFSPNNRPNQIGPEAMGWRTTGQNINLNRDYSKADAPEMAALLQLLGRWDPILYVDLHVTDGAQFQHEVALCLEPLHAGPDELRALGREANDAVMAELASKGRQPIDFYPSLRDNEDPSSGFALDISPPRYSDGYWPLRNRFAVLVETHSWKDYETRVRVTRESVLALLRVAAEKGSAWLQAAHAADERDRHPDSPDVALAYSTTGEARTIPFKGYAYEYEDSDISGKRWLRYDPSQPSDWEVPLFDQLVVAQTAQAPRGGYLVSAAHAGWMQEKLKLHGFEFQTLTRAREGVEVEVFRASQVHLQSSSYEGRVGVSLEGSWSRERRDLPAGSLYVPAAQRGRRLLVHLFEPAGSDSFVSWGFFHNAFERKEYMEDYVAEAVAREMLEQDPGLAEEFWRRVEQDEGFAGDPGQRLEFFKRRHPSWDERFNLYPVFRLDGPLA